MTIKQFCASVKAANAGLTCTWKPLTKEYRVAFADGTPAEKEAAAYYTNDQTDAANTARMMWNGRYLPKVEASPLLAHRCAKHSICGTLPSLCAVCQRINVEAEIVTRTVEALLKAGFALSTDQGEGAFVPAKPTTSREIILSALMQTDDEHLFAFAVDAPAKSGRHRGWVRFVYGNGGFDVISDYTTNLESVLAPVNAYADTLA